MSKAREFWISEAHELPPPIPHVDKHVDDYILETSKHPGGPRVNWIHVREVTPSEITVPISYWEKVKEALEFIANGCLVPPDGGSPKHPDDCMDSARQALQMIGEMGK